MKLVSILLLLALACASVLSAAPVPLASDTVAEAFAPACSAAPASLQALASAMPDTKCASCNDQFRACKAFCGTNNPIFSCQGSNPCAATCICP